MKLGALALFFAANTGFAAITVTNFEVYLTFDDASKSGNNYVDQWDDDGDVDNVGRPGTVTTAGKFGEAANTSTSNSTPRGLTTNSAVINSSMMPGTDDYTLSFWYRQNNTAGNRIFNAGARGNDGNNDDGLQIYYTGSQIEVAFHSPSVGDTTRLSFTTTTPGLTFDGVAWNHFALVRNGDALDLWINGAIRGGTTLPTGYNIAVGGATWFREPNFGPDASVTNSAWDDTGIWHTALTAGEIGQIYNGGTGATIASLIPEPSSTALLGLGGLALILRRRR